MYDEFIPTGFDEEDPFGPLPMPKEDPDYVPDKFSAPLYEDFFIEKYGKEKGAELSEIYNTILKQANKGAAEALFDLGVICRTDVSSKYYSLIDSYSWFLKAAEAGHPGGQFMIGRKYLYGIGVNRDVDAAVEWFVKSSENGYTISENYLGRLYYSGKQLTNNYEKALHCFERAAKRSDPIAMCNLAMYIYRFGTDMDRSFASMLLKAAASTKAYFNPAKDMFSYINISKEEAESIDVSEIYSNFFDPDHEKCRDEWLNDYNTRYENEDTDQNELKHFFDKGDARSYEYDEQIKLDTANYYMKTHNRPFCWETVEWDIEKLVRDGDAEAMYYYAWFKLWDDDNAFQKLIQMSAIQGFPKALVTMGRIVDKWGNEVTPEGEKYYITAAKAGNPEGMWRYGKYLLNSCIDEDCDDHILKLKENSSDEDLQKALTWIEKAGVCGECDALVRLGEIYQYGINDSLIEKDEKKSYDFYYRASVAGDYRGSMACGLAFEEGRGVGINYTMARNLYEKARDEGFYEGDCWIPEIDFRLGRLLYHGIGGEAEKEDGMYLMMTALNEERKTLEKHVESIISRIKAWGISKIDLGVAIYSYGLPGRVGDDL